MSAEEKKIVYTFDADTKPLNDKVDGVTESMTGLENQTKSTETAAKTGFKSMVSGILAAGKAFLANPIGIILAGLTAAFFAIKKAMSSFTEGQDALAAVTGVLSGTLTILTNVFKALASGIIYAVTEPKKAWDSFVTALDNGATFVKDRVLGVLTGYFEIWAGGLNLIFAEVKLAWTKVFGSDSDVAKARANIDAAYKQIEDGGNKIIDQGKAITTVFIDMGKAIGDVVSEAVKLEQAALALKRLELVTLKSNAALERSLTIQQKIADNATNSLEDREKAAVISLDLAKKIAAADIKYATAAEKLAKDKAKLDKDNSIETQKNIIELTNARIAAQTEYEVAVIDGEQTLAELRSDAFEIALDAEVDFTDKKKSLLLKIVEAEESTISAKYKAYAQAKILDEESYARQIDMFNKLSKKKIDTNEIAKLSDADQVKSYLKGLGLSEVLTNRFLTDVLKERLQSSADLATAYDALNDSVTDRLRSERENASAMEITNEAYASYFNVSEEYVEREEANLKKLFGIIAETNIRRRKLTGEAAEAEVAAQQETLDNIIKSYRTNQRIYKQTLEEASEIAEARFLADGATQTDLLTVFAKQRQEQAILMDEQTYALKFALMQTEESILLENENAIINKKKEIRDETLASLIAGSKEYIAYEKTANAEIIKITEEVEENIQQIHTDYGKRFTILQGEQRDARIQFANDLREWESDSLKLTHTNRIDEATKFYKKELLTINAWAKEQGAAQRDIDLLNEKAALKHKANIEAIDESLFKARMSQVLNYTNMVAGAYEDIIGAMNAFEEEAVERQLEVIESKYDAMVNASEIANNRIADHLDVRLARGEISQREYDDEIRKAAIRAAKEASDLEKKKIEEKNRINEEAFNAAQEQDIISATMNGALAVAQTFATFGYPAGIPAALAAAIAVGAEISTISAQSFNPQKLALGGILNGPSHANGGIDLGNGQEVEGGESILSAATTTRFEPIIGELNDAGNSGRNAKLINEDSLAKKIGNAVNRNIKAYVVSTEMTEQQSRDKSLDAYISL